MAGIEDFHRNMRRIIKKRLDPIERKATEALSFVGEEFVAKAKIKGNYRDRTGNLRSSIGYIVQKDGEIEKEAFDGEKEDGVKEGQNFAHKLSPQWPNGHILIGVAGMKYAASVEHKNYDVISGSAPDEQEFKEFIAKALS